MDSEKSMERDRKSTGESTGDRRTGSVGERSELRASTIGGDRRAGSTSETKSAVSRTRLQEIRRTIPVWAEPRYSVGEHA